MTTIQLRDVEGAARRLMRAASIEIPKDFSGQVRRMAGQLDNPLACFVLNSMLDTWDAADADQRPMGAGTGLPRRYVKVGNQARIEGGLIALEAVLRWATAEATRDIPLRPNRVHPLSRKDPAINVGIHAPDVQNAFEPPTTFFHALVILVWATIEMDPPGDAKCAIETFEEIARRFTLKDAARVFFFRIDEVRDRFLSNVRKAGLPD
jgi:L(+)-tartrate dehydratase alpha subunit